MSKAMGHTAEQRRLSRIKSRGLQVECGIESARRVIAYAINNGTSFTRSVVPIPRLVSIKDDLYLVRSLSRYSSKKLDRILGVIENS